MNKLIIFPTFVLMLLFLAGMLGAFSGSFSYSNSTGVIIPHENATTTTHNGALVTCQFCEQTEAGSWFCAWEYLNDIGVGNGTYYYTIESQDLSGVGIGASGVEESQNGTLYSSGGLLGFGYDLTVGFMLIVGAVMVIVGITGLKIFDIGLDTFSTKTITLGSIYMGTWIFLSSFSLPLLGLIPLGIGVLCMYLPLSMMYVFGFFQTLTHESG